MEHKSRLLDERKLENGLTVYIYDESRPVAGDRWQVQLVARIPLELRQEHFQNISDSHEAYLSFSASIGPSLTFRQERVRNFIAGKEVENLLSQMKEEFLKSSLPYLSSSRFPEKFVRTQYERWVNEERVRKAHLQTIQGNR